MSNIAVIAGNVGRDPEIRNAGSGRVANFSVAVTRNKDVTDWVDVAFWGEKQVELIENYVKKGSSVVINGSLRVDTWTTKEGDSRKKVYIYGTGIKFMGGKKDDGGTYSKANTKKTEEYDSYGDDIPPF